MGSPGASRRRRRRPALNRGDVYDAELVGGRRPVVLLTRDWAIPFLSNVTVAMVTGNVRGLPTEVPVGQDHGLERDSVVNCDNLVTLHKTTLRRRRGALDAESLQRLREALVLALDLT